MSRLKGKIVLVTGGSGSFGRAFVKRALQEQEPAKVIVFSRDEWKQWEMQNDFSEHDSERLRFFLGDVRDKERLHRALNDVQVVVHAAALKQVPAAEYNPTEFVQTNIHGAMNVIDASIDRGVEHLIALSTDKSVNPVNLYGATKLCSDKLFLAANAYTGKARKPKMSVVRYGNVLGSRGSLLPFWQQLIQKGAKELPVTDPEMTRFWIPLQDAVDFVTKCFSEMQGEELFVPKMPSVKITEMAKAIAPDLPIKIIGIREGEKLHELLISPDESHYTLEMKDHFLLLPPIYAKTFEERSKRRGGTKVDASFSYTSNNNPHLLNAAELKKII